MKQNHYAFFCLPSVYIYYIEIEIYIKVVFCPHYLFISIIVSLLLSLCLEDLLYYRQCVVSLFIIVVAFMYVKFMYASCILYTMF